MSSFYMELEKDSEIHTKDFQTLECNINAKHQG